jgi:DNA-binding beta-propeller fold protein YncE
MRFPGIVGVASLFLLAGTVPCVAQTPTAGKKPVAAGPALRLASTVTLPGYKGDFDHFAVDRERGRILLAAEDHATLEVFDLKTGRHLKTITGFGVPHSILIRPGAKTIIVTDSDQMSHVLDAETYAPKGSITLVPGADSAAYDSAANVYYVVTGGKDVKMATCTLAAVNPDTGKVLASIEFKDNHVEAMTLEKGGSRLFINLAQTNQVAVVDRKSMKVLAMWPVPPAKQNAMVALDEPTHRLFVVARDPGMVIVMSSDDGKVITTAPAPLRADEVLYDAAAHRLYVPGGEGYIGVYDTSEPKKLKEIAKVPSAYGAKTAMLLADKKQMLVAASPGETKNVAKILTYSIP